MPVLESVVIRLGLDPGFVHRLAVSEAGAARAAMQSHPVDEKPYGSDFPGPDVPEERWDEAEDSLRHQAWRWTDYVTTHGFRAMGLLALFDQPKTVNLADELCAWLYQLGHPSWPLALSFSRPWSRRQFGAEQLHELAGDSPGYPSDLARLLDAPSRDLNYAAPVSRASWTTSGLSPYGIDLRLFRLIVRPSAPGSQDFYEVEPFTISVPSTPAVLYAGLMSIEDRLLEVRADEYHWRRGLTSIQATDPEIVLTIKAVLASPVGDALREISSQQSMTASIVDVVEATQDID